MDRVTRAGNADGAAFPVDESLYNAPSRASGRVFIVQRVEKHEGVMSTFPTAHRTLKSAIDWATLDVDVPDWQSMRFHTVEAPDGVIGKFESDFVGTCEREFFEIFEMRIE